MTEYLPTGREFAAARALLWMGQRDLAEAAEVSVTTVRRIEADDDAVATKAKQAVLRALHQAGAAIGPGRVEIMEAER